MTSCPRGLVPAAAAVAMLAMLAAALGIGVRSTFGAQLAGDEPQYLLTALSLAEDGDLDIADELAAQRWRAFADVEPPVQTAARGDGSRISPHDPLLPALLAAPAGWGGWVGAKLALTLLAGTLAAVTLWTAVRRFAVPVPLAAVGVGIAAGSAPLAMYGQQLYPELPAALAVVAAVAALTGPAGRRQLVVLVVAVVALPWLSVKYAPVAAALGALGLARWWRAGRRRRSRTPWALVTAGLLAVLGAVYLAVHRALWGGWTVYASGDHFERTGEFSVMGTDPDYAGRALRLVGLLVDREFGLAAWQPAWLLVVPALAALAVRRPPGGGALALPLATGWVVATFVALTMHGFWWPGRQVVVVLPLATVGMLWWLARAGTAVRGVAIGLGLAGILSYGWLLAEGYARQLTWVSGFPTTDSPAYRLLRPLLPDYQGKFWTGHLAWMVMLILLAAAGWHAATRASQPDAPRPTALTAHQQEEGKR